MRLTKKEIVLKLYALSLKPSYVLKQQFLQRHCGNPLIMQNGQMWTNIVWGKFTWPIQELLVINVNKWFILQSSIHRRRRSNLTSWHAGSALTLVGLDFPRFLLHCTASARFPCPLLVEVTHPAWCWTFMHYTFQFWYPADQNIQQLLKAATGQFQCCINTANFSWLPKEIYNSSVKI